MDCILAVDPGKSIVGRRSVTGKEPFFAGHFPGRSVMPGVLILEMMTQLAARLLPPEDRTAAAFCVTGIRRARFLCLVVPGDLLIISVTLTHRHENGGQAKGEARVAGKLVCDMNFSFSLNWEKGS